MGLGSLISTSLCCNARLRGTSHWTYSQTTVWSMGSHSLARNWARKTGNTWRSAMCLRTA